MFFWLQISVPRSWIYIKTYLFAHNLQEFLLAYNCAKYSCGGHSIPKVLPNGFLKAIFFRSVLKWKDWRGAGKERESERRKMALWLKSWPAIQEIWVQFPALPLTSCVTLGKLDNLSVPQFMGMVIILPLSLSAWSMNAPRVYLHSPDTAGTWAWHSPLVPL